MPPSSTYEPIHVQEPSIVTQPLILRVERCTALVIGSGHRIRKTHRRNDPTMVHIQQSQQWARPRLHMLLPHIHKLMLQCIMHCYFTQYHQHHACSVAYVAKRMESAAGETQREREVYLTPRSCSMSPDCPVFPYRVVFLVDFK